MILKNLIEEELKINSENKKLNTIYRKTLEQVFTKKYLDKIDAYFINGLNVKNIEKNNNVVAITSGVNVFVNSVIYDNLPTDRAVVYLIHETFHVLQNISLFKELKKINDELCKKALSVIPKKEMSLFLTGKKQDIHSDFRKEFLSYFSNNAFLWNLNKEIKEEFKNIINSYNNIFNIKSNWWKKRID